MEKKNILIIGGGGREHAIAYSLSCSNKVGKLYCAPGNAGIAELAECVNLDVCDKVGIINFLSTHTDVYMTVVAPDNPLADGMVDALEEAGFRAFGPRKNAAQLEGSKAFAKDIMKKYGIPTADYEVFTEYDSAYAYLQTAKYPLVLKADGLALGKGVLICEDKQMAEDGLKEIMVDMAFGSAGSKLVVEEFLTGFECSYLAFTDGKTVLPMTTSQDHKRALDGDLGLNTGGMGTFSPSNKVTEELNAEVCEKVLKRVVEGLNAEGIEFKGVLYAGLMIDNGNLKVLEFNARFGDPETQVILPRLKTDLFDIFEACIDGTLDKCEIEWAGGGSVCVIVASGGYPEAYEKGKEITIGDLDEDIILFHSGTKMDGDKLVTNGGRVIGITAVADTLEDAREKAYANVSKVNFEGKHFRTDILKG